MAGRMMLILLCWLLLPGPAAAATDGPVRLGYLQNDIHQLACWVALENGLFEQEGLEVEVAGIFKAGPEQMSAFAAGALDAGYVGAAPATTAVANRVARVRVVAQVNTEGSALVVRRDDPAAGLADLAGRRVAVPGHSTVQDFLLRKAMSMWGLGPKALDITVLKPPEMINALRTEQIDAFVAWEPHPSKACTMGVGRRLASSGAIWPAHPCCVLVVDERFLERRPEAVRALLRAHIRATDFINREPEAALAIGVKYTGMDSETVRQAMENVNYTYEISVEGEREYVEFLTRLKYIQVEDVDAFVAAFLYQDLLRELLGR